MKKLIVGAAMLAVVMSGCKKDPDPTPVDTYTMEERARDGLYELMKVMYLWNTQIPTVKVSDYAGPDDLLEAMRYTAKDKWSFVTSYDDFIASMEGSFVGHGIRMGLDPSDNVRVVSLYKNSDLWPQGVRRGWIVVAVNDTPLAPIFIEGDGTAYNNVMGASTAGITNKFLFKKPDGTEVTLYSTKANFTINSVTADTVFDRPYGKTAYLCFESFIEPSEEELNTAFASFIAKGATNIIVDLRYNGGGYMSIAQQLASQIIGNSHTTDICYRLKYNTTVAADWDESYNFITTDTPLGVNKVVFITTRSSASASEVVINSLKPYMDVYLVGDTTHGKPVGMNLWGFPFPSSSVPDPDYEYVFAPITFEYVNASGEGRFYDGMVPNILAADDLTRDFGDTEELSLKAALSIIEGTTTKSAVSLPGKRSVIFSEGDQLPTNLILDSPKSFKK